MRISLGEELEKTYLGKLERIRMGRLRPRLGKDLTRTWKA